MGRILASLALGVSLLVAVVRTHDQLLWVYACDAVCKGRDALFNPLAP